MRRLLVMFGLCLATIFLCCCSSKNGIQRIFVNGKVTFHGEPVQSGRIRFVPISGTLGPVSGGKILLGNYRIDAKGGVPVGAHRVEITAFRTPKSAESIPEAAVPGCDIPMQQILPAKYNKNSELEATVESADGELTIDFRLD